MDDEHVTITLDLQGRWDLRKFRELRWGRAPYLQGANIRINDFFKMDSQGQAVGRLTAASSADSLCDIEDDASETVLVEIDLLIVRDLAHVADKVRLCAHATMGVIYLPDVDKGGW